MNKEQARILVITALLLILCAGGTLVTRSRTQHLKLRQAALEKETAENSVKLEASIEKRQNTRQTNMMMLSPFIDRVNKDLENGHVSKEKISAFIAIDGDHMGQLNEKYGIDKVGDLIADLAGTFKKTFGDKENDILCNVGDGSDEFYFLLQNRDSKEQVENEIASLIECWHNHDKTYGGVAIPGTFSAGIAFYPDDGKDFLTLYKKADKALYMAKHNGRDQYAVYKEE